MAGEVTLTAAMRNGLLAAQRTGALVERTTDRLASGLKVSSVKDDAVAFFQARGLNERAADFANIKDDISGGISTIKAALDGLSAVESLIAQMKGLALGAKGEPNPGNRQAMFRQYQKLLSQIDNIAGDAHYNGLNLIGTPTQDLTVNLSPADNAPRSSLTVAGTSITYFNLGLTDDVRVSVIAADYPSDPVKTQLVDDWVASIGRETRNGSTGAVQSYATLDAIPMGDSLDPFGSALGSPGYLGMVQRFAEGTISFDAPDIGAYTGHTSGAVQYQAALVAQDYFANGGTLGATVTDTGLATAAYTSGNYPAQSLTVPQYPWDSVTNYMDHIDYFIGKMDAAVASVRSTMADLGSSTSMLQIRIDYTDKLIVEGKQGASKLVNADLNEEGASLAALQTRQQIASQSLKFTGDSEKGILSLFR